MNAEKTPPNPMGAAAPSTLFCLCGPAGSEKREAHQVLENVRGLLPLLNLSSSCYLVSPERPGQGMLLDSFLEAVSCFLEENRFVQVTLRPVHPFSADDADEWLAAYLRFLRVCRPFQEEGYREQIISRLRIFPVLFLSDVGTAAGAGPFLKFLKDSFFLPSLLVPEQCLPGFADLEARQDEPPWVRVYVTDVSSFAPPKTLEILRAHEIFDRLLEEDPAGSRDGEPPCLDSLTLDPEGLVRFCLKAKGTEASLFAAQRAKVDSGSPAFPSDSGADLFSCMECLLPTMETVGTSYRIHRHGAAAWHRFCDRVANRFVRRGMHDQALTVWKSSARACGEARLPENLGLHIALCHYGKGDLEAAMEALRDAERAAPGSADIRYYMGLCEFGWKDYIEAADRFQEAIEMGLHGPLQVEAHYYRGLSHYHLEEYDEALEPLAQAERAGMGGSPLPFYQGLCLLGKGEPHQALPYLQEALARGPSEEDRFHVLFYIAHTYKELEEFQQALAYCAKAEAVEPRRQELWNLAGFCHFKMREYDEAIGCFEKAIEIDPGSAIDYANIGSNLRDKGDREGAVAMYQKALSLDPTIEFARDSLKRLLEE